jgi:hypothetical protein
VITGLEVAVVFGGLAALLAFLFRSPKLPVGASVYREQQARREHETTYVKGGWDGETLRQQTRR